MTTARNNLKEKTKIKRRIAETQSALKELIITNINKTKLATMVFETPEAKRLNKTKKQIYQNLYRPAIEKSIQEEALMAYYDKIIEIAKQMLDDLYKTFTPFVILLHGQYLSFLSDDQKQQVIEAQKELTDQGLIVFTPQISATEKFPQESYWDSIINFIKKSDQKIIVITMNGTNTIPSKWIEIIEHPKTISLDYQKYKYTNIKTEIIHRYFNLSDRNLNRL